MYIIKMSASLIKTCTQFSILKQSLSNIVKQRRCVQYNVTNCFVIRNQYGYYHTTSINFKKLKRDVKTIIPKQTKKSAEIVDVWKNMRIADVANVTKRSVQDVITAALITDNSRKYSETTVLDDLNLILGTMNRLGFRYKIISKEKKVDESKEDFDVTKRPPPDESVLVKRRPVVTIMGHVDHGKTTLLDALRNTSVVDTEFGGITQHIGAFNVELSTGEKVTFLDTPGHAAFSSMRERGAQITDIVILVVAADDGVMEQTVQSINMAKAANVPIIVAINKIDKQSADIARTQRMLQERDIIVEELGGDVQCVCISALKGTNLNTLIEAIALQAELMDLKGDPTGLVEGVVIECNNDINRGKLSTALVRRGTLKKGAVLVSGTAWAKVRSMFDHAGKPVLKGGLSDAIQIMGWRSLPNVGSEILEVESEQDAHIVIRYREQKIKNQKAEEHTQMANIKLQEHLAEYKERLAKKRSLQWNYCRQKREKEYVPDTTPAVNVIIKGDVAGSVEAILDVIDTYPEHERCRLNVVHYGVGPVIESDVEIAVTFNAIIYRFNVIVSKDIQEKLKERNILIRAYNVIYQLIDDIKLEINEKLPLEETNEIIGEAKVLKMFEITAEKKKVNVAGCLCTSGNLKKNEMYRLLRDGEVIHTGKLISMRHLKNEVESIKSGTECGLRFADASIEIRPNDTIVCFKIFLIKPNVDWNPGF